MANSVEAVSEADSAERSITITFENSVGDLDLFLYDGAGNLIQKSEGSTNSEKLNFGGLAAGTYYVQVKSQYNHVNAYVT